MKIQTAMKTQLSKIPAKMLNSSWIFLDASMFVIWKSTNKAKKKVNWRESVPG
jgi:hypothetical protein